MQGEIGPVGPQGEPGISYTALKGLPGLPVSMTTSAIVPIRAYSCFIN